MNRRSTFKLGHRAKGIAQLLAAQQIDAARFQLERLTFGLNPKHLDPHRDAIRAICQAFEDNQPELIQAQADEIIKLALSL